MPFLIWRKILPLYEIQEQKAPISKMGKLAPWPSLATINDHRRRWLKYPPPCPRHRNFASQWAAIRPNWLMLLI